jgi:hypothetical protein
MMAKQNPSAGGAGAFESATVQQSLYTQNRQPNQPKFEPLRLATAKAFFEKRVRGLTGIDEADRHIFEGYLTAATWAPVCDVGLEPVLIDFLEALRSQARAAIAAHQSHEKLRTAIYHFHQRSHGAWTDRQGGFAS